MSDIECERGTLNRLEQYFFIDNDRGWTAVRKKREAIEIQSPIERKNIFKKRLLPMIRVFGPQRGELLEVWGGCNGMIRKLGTA